MALRVASTKRVHAITHLVTQLKNVIASSRRLELVLTTYSACAKAIYEEYRHLTPRGFAARHQPERGPAVRAVLKQLLLVLDATSPDGVI